MRVLVGKVAETCTVPREQFPQYYLILSHLISEPRNVAGTSYVLSMSM